jgi:hypothetical protein
MLRDDDEGQLVLRILPFGVAIVILAVAILEMQSGAIGIGLILLGVFTILAGFEGTLTFGIRSLKISGTAGFVLLILGAIFYAFITHR